MRRILAAAVVVLGSLVSTASPAQAASGPWATVSAGGSFTCAINSGKSLYCWGNNELGQVGDGTTSGPVKSPKKIGASGVWAAVSVGGNHACAITTGRSLYCWGNNNSGQIGDGSGITTSPVKSPKKIGASGVWAGVSTGGAHTCAVSTGKSLYCWGHNGAGQIGDGSNVYRLSPKKIGASGVWAGASTGSFHTCAVTTGKSLYCWGRNGEGQVGDGTATHRASPKKIGASGAWAGADAGGDHTCAVTTGKSLYCWGRNDNGQVGDGSTTYRFSPKKIGASAVWAGVSAGGNQTCAISTGKSLYCWGRNDNGQVGDGSTTSPVKSPKKIGASAVWAGVSTGGAHTCAVTTATSLYCWGYNFSGQVGDGSTTSPVTSPKKIP